MANEYASLEEVKSELGIGDQIDDTLISAVIEQVSRAVDAQTRNRFYAATETRYYTYDGSGELRIDPLLSIEADGLKTDIDGTGTYTDTWATTDYVLLPRNAVLDGKPYTSIRTAVNGAFGFPRFQQGIQIEGDFGYSTLLTVPPPVKRATIIWVVRLLRRPSAPFGAYATPDGGSSFLITRMDPDVKVLLDPYSRVLVA